MANLNNLYAAVLTGKSPIAVAIMKEAIEENVDPQYAINEYVVKTTEEINSHFETGRAFVPELLMATRTMKGSLELLKPQLAGNHNRLIAKIIIGTIKGDLHDIGKDLVASVFKGYGFRIINSGTDVSTKKPVDAVCEYRADILCMSALLTTTINYMHEAIAALDESGVHEKVRVTIGSAPTAPEFARQTGTDGYSDNADSAVILAKNLLAS